MVFVIPSRSKHNIGSDSFHVGYTPAVLAHFIVEKAQGTFYLPQKLFSLNLLTH